MKTRKAKKSAKRSDPLRAYRFTLLIRHFLSAFYGIMLGYAIMAGNAVINYFVGVLSAIMAYIVLKSIAGKYLVKIKLEPTEPAVVRGGQAVIVAKIRNYSPFIYPVSFLLVKDSLNPAGQRIFFCVRPFAKLSMAFPLTFIHCGSYPLRPVSAHVISAGGMVWAKTLLRKKGLPVLSVTPEQRHAVIDQSAGEGSGESAVSVKPSVSMTDSVFIRQYVPGDDPRFIHWKRSAAREDWQLRSFYQESERNYIVFFDARMENGLNRDMSAYSDPFGSDPEFEHNFALADKLSSAAVSISGALLKEGIPFYFAYPASPAISSVFCDSNTAFGQIRTIAGTIPFAPLPSPEPPAVGASPAAGAREQTGPFDRSLVTTLAALLPSADSGVTVIRICPALKNDAAVSAGLSGPSGSAGPAASASSSAAAGSGATDGSSLLSDPDDLSVSRPAAVSLSRDTRRLLSPAEFSIHDLPEAECFAEQLHGAFIISVEVKP
ncbi:MAG: DUF58 domain-containing protein [Clostridia bacterium]|nr:DUF58 domain-containing protein [Clostridia bacterium]